MHRKELPDPGARVRAWKGSVKRRGPASPAPHQKKVSTPGLSPRSLLRI